MTAEIKNRIHDLGITITDLSIYTGINRSELSKFLSGKRSIQTAKYLLVLEALGMNISYTYDTFNLEIYQLKC